MMSGNTESPNGSRATGLPIACTTESEMSALGAAVVARGLVEPAAPLADLATEMAPPVRAVKPGHDAGLYRDLFREYAASLPVDHDEG